MTKEEFLRYCREVASDDVIDNIIWRFEGHWYDVGPQCRNAAVDGIKYRHEVVTEPERSSRLPQPRWKEEAERRRWFAGPQPKTANRERAIALAKFLPALRYQGWSYPCHICGREASCYMEGDVHVPICMNCHSAYYRGDPL